MRQLIRRLEETLGKVPADLDAERYPRLAKGFRIGHIAYDPRTKTYQKSYSDGDVVILGKKGDEGEIEKWLLQKRRTTIAKARN